MSSRRRETHDRLAERRLAHAVAPDDRDRLVAHLERDVLERLRAAVERGEALDGEQRCLRHPAGAPCPDRGRGRAGSRGSPPACLRRSCCPSCIIVTYSATRSATSMSCSIRMSVIERSRPSSRSVSATRSPRERPDAGSSSIISFGFPARAIPTSSWRCSPWESEPTSVGSFGARPTASARLPCLLAHRSVAAPAARRAARARTGRRAAARYRLSSTESPRKRRDFWYVRDIPSLALVRAGANVVSLPRNSIVPAVGSTSPEMTLNSVVLPAPFGPRMARRSPCATSRSTSRTAWRPPNRRPTPRKRRIGSAGSDGAAEVIPATG